MRRLLVPALTACLAGAALAHFPLLLPDRPQAELGKPSLLELGYGHPFEAERGAARRPLAFRVHPPAGAPVDLTAALEPTGTDATRGWRASYVPAQRGDHLVEVEGAPAEHEGRLERDWVKLVLHVPAVQAGWDRVLGRPLELAPLTRPYGLPVGATFRALVLRDGKPLAGALVEVERKNDAPPAELPPEPFVTRVEKADPQGAVAVTLDAPGWWVLVASAERPGAEGGAELHRAALWVFVGR
jgi:cobalt/nickel transport protein